jgi:hypothetical protein
MSTAVQTWEQLDHGPGTGSMRREGGSYVFEASIRFPIGWVPLVPVWIEPEGAATAEAAWGYLDSGAYRSLVPRSVVEAAGLSLDALGERRTNHGVGIVYTRDCPGTIRLVGGEVLTAEGFMVNEGPEDPFVEQAGASLVLGLDCFMGFDVSFQGWNRLKTVEDHENPPTITLTPRGV